MCRVPASHGHYCVCAPRSASFRLQQRAGDSRTVWVGQQLQRSKHQNITVIFCINYASSVITHTPTMTWLWRLWSETRFCFLEFSEGCPELPPTPAVICLTSLFIERLCCEVYWQSLLPQYIWCVTSEAFSLSQKSHSDMMWLSLRVAPDLRYTNIMSAICDIIYEEDPFWVFLSLPLLHLRYTQSRGGSWHESLEEDWWRARCQATAGHKFACGTMHWLVA